jgi:FkbM family methyltransferase
MDPAINANLQTANGWVTLPASLKRADGTPRFSLNFPAYFLTDPGAAHLVGNEIGDGYEPPTRNLIERVLRRGDVFVDVGAHWGFFALQAATHPAGEIDVIAFEPELMNATILYENVARNKSSNVTVVCAACGHENALAPLLINSTMGHSISGADSRLDARAPSKWVPVVTLDGALANLQKPADRRLILKIDAEGFEPNIIAGAKSLLTAGRVALIVWECGGAFFEGRGHAAMAKMVAFRHFRSPENGNDHPAIEFDPEGDWYGNVFSFAPQLIDEVRI